MQELEIVSKHLQEEIARLNEEIAAGKAGDFAEYKSACGVRLGLMRANGIVLEVAEKLQKEEEG